MIVGLHDNVVIIDIRVKGEKAGKTESTSSL